MQSKKYEVPNVGAAAVDVAVPNAGADANPVPKPKPTKTNTHKITFQETILLNQCYIIHSRYNCENCVFLTSILQKTKTASLLQYKLNTALNLAYKMDSE